MNRKIFAGTMAVLMAAVSLTGCGDKKQEASDNDVLSGVVHEQTTTAVEKVTTETTTEEMTEATTEEVTEAVTEESSEVENTVNEEFMESVERLKERLSDEDVLYVESEWKFDKLTKDNIFNTDWTPCTNIDDSSFYLADSDYAVYEYGSDWHIRQYPTRYQSDNNDRYFVKNEDGSISAYRCNLVEENITEELSGENVIISKTGIIDNIADIFKDIQYHDDIHAAATADAFDIKDGDMVEAPQIIYDLLRDCAKNDNVFDISDSKIMLCPESENGFIAIDDMFGLCKIDMDNVNCQITDAVLVSTGQKINISFRLNDMYLKFDILTGENDLVRPDIVIE